FNGEGHVEVPWRKGKLCLDTDLAVLRRQCLDEEPRGAGARLAWHIRRAIAWLSLASRNELLRTGDFFELPDYPSARDRLVVFSEGRRSLEFWRGSPVRSGYVELAAVPAAKLVWAVRAFAPGKGKPIRALSWGSFLHVKGRPAPLGIWLLVEQPV